MVRLFSHFRLLVCFAAVFGFARSAVYAQPEFIATKGFNLPVGSRIVSSEDGDLFAFYNTALFRSFDKGISWEHAATLPYQITSIFAPAGNDLYIITQTSPTSVFKSTDNGATVNQSFVYQGYLTAILESDGQFLRAMSSNAVTTSTNGGQSWSTPIYAYMYFVRGDLHYKFSSTWEWSSDKGNTWKSLNTEFGYLTFNDSKIRLADTVNIRSTSNSGTTWFTARMPFNSSPYNTIWQLASDSNENIFAYGPTSDVFYFSRNDGADWDSIRLSSSLNQFSCLSDGRALIYAGDLYVFEDDRLQPWSASIMGISVVMDDGSGTLWSNGYQSKNYRSGLASSKDKGITWQQSPLNPKGLITSVLPLGQRVLAASSFHLYYPSSRQIYLSTDEGDSWQTVRTFDRDTAVVHFTVTGSSILAGTNVAGIFRSEDGGVTWTESNTGLTNGVINALETDRMSRILACTNNGLFISSDQGLSWNKHDVSPWDPYVFGVAVRKDGMIYAGTSEGLYRSIDGNEWTREYIGLLDYRVSTLSIDSADNIYAGTEYWYVDGETDDRFLLHMSTNGGASWTELRQPILNSDSSTLTGTWTDKAGFVFVASSIGLYRSLEAPKGVAKVRPISGSGNQAIRYIDRKFLVDSDDAVEAHIELYDRAGRSVYSATGLCSELERQLNQTTLGDHQWLAYVLQSNGKTERGTLLIF